jgi:hypothetical protein
MSDTLLTAQAREEIRGFLYKITLPIITVITVLAGVIGYSIKDYTISEAIRVSQSEFMDSFTEITAQSLEMRSTADSILKDLNNKQRDVEKILVLLDEYRRGSSSLADDETFAQKVADLIELNNVFKWRKVEYSQNGHFKNNCLYLLRENYYLKPAELPDTYYGPDFRTTMVAHQVSQQGLKFLDKDEKIQTLEYFDLKEKEFGQNGTMAPSYIAYEACFTHETNIVISQAVRVESRN